MSAQGAAEALASTVMSFYNAVREINIEWKTKNSEQISALDGKKREIEETQNHELEKLKSINKEKLERIKMRESQKTREYGDFLNSLDCLKQQLIEAYPNMPTAIALILYQRGATLLDELWQKEVDDNQRLAAWRTLLSLSEKVMEDVNAVMDESQKLSHQRLPQNTMRFLRAEA